MRESLIEQLSLTPAPIAHSHAVELCAVAALLDRLPEATRLVHEDLSIRHGKRVDPTKGRDGMAAEQVLRVAILKQRTGLSYERLAFSLADSSTFRSFCRLGYEQKVPTKSALQKNIKRVTTTTWEKVNQLVVRLAQQLGVEEGTKVRTDCLVVKSNIHYPTDSSLLWDSVRVLSRLMKRGNKVCGLHFVNHRLRAKRRALEISNATSKDQRKPLYRDLLVITEHTVEQARQMAEQLRTLEQSLLAARLAQEIEHYLPLVEQVISQTERRVLRDEVVPSAEKVVSIFEPHTNIIVQDNRKDNRDTKYGHKVCITTGASALVTHAVVEEGNPADCTLATKMIEAQRLIFGQSPRQASFDGGFATKANLVTIKALGVEDVVFHKRCDLQIRDMASSNRVYKALRAFRAGIEGSISFLKRVFGLARCAWRGFDSFQSYVHASIVSCNLLVIARRLLASA